MDRITPLIFVAFSDQRSDGLSPQGQPLLTVVGGNKMGDCSPGSRRRYRIRRKEQRVRGV